MLSVVVVSFADHAEWVEEQFLATPVTTVDVSANCWLVVAQHKPLSVEEMQLVKLHEERVAPLVIPVVRVVEDQQRQPVQHQG